MTGIVSCDSAAVRIRAMGIIKNTNLAKQRPGRVSPPCLLVDRNESVLKVPRQGQFHTAICLTLQRCDSCGQSALGTRTVSRRNFCDAELLRAAHLQNEIAPENFRNRCKMVWITRKRIRKKRPETCLTNFKPLSHRLKKFSPALFQ